MAAAGRGWGTVERIALGSILVGVLVLALKFAAYAITGSVALLSDALESIINVVAAGAALLTIRIASRPADADHPYGHYKAEYFSAVLEGVLIVVAAILILRESYLALADPRGIDAPIPGLLLNGLATLANAGWAMLLVRRGRDLRSPALAADGRHLWADVVTSLGVIAGVVVVALTDIAVLDPIIASAVALNIVWSGWRVIRDSVGGLMDEAVTPDVLARIEAAIGGRATEASGAIEAHDLRTRRAGRMTFIEFHLVVPGAMSVTEAHRICDRLERALRAEVADALISIHVEPETKAKQAGILIG